MKLRFTHVCLLCVVVLATGEEHEHGFDHHEVEINKSARAAKVSGSLQICFLSPFAYPDDGGQARPTCRPWP